MKYANALLFALLVVLAGCTQRPDQAAMAYASAEDGQAAGNALAPNAGAEAARAMPATEVQLRRVWTSSYKTFEFSSVSPDGRYLSMVDWSTIDLAVRDLSSGDVYRLTEAVRGPDIPYEGTVGSVFSSDGSKLLFGWQRVPDVQLRTLDFEPDATGAPRPASPRVIFDNPAFEPYVPFDWSPDGAQVLAKVWMGGGENHTHTVNHLALIATADGSLQTLRSFDWREPMRAAFSPDGRFVAYDFPPEDDDPNRDIFVAATDGSRDEVVVDGGAVDRLLDWHPDGFLLFHSDRGGSPGVWRLPMADGRATGPAVLVKADMWGVEPLGSGPDRFYYGVDVSPPRLQMATLDLEAGALITEPVSLVDPSELEVTGWDWSPDGEYLAYSATRPGTSGSVIGFVSSGGTDRQTIRLDLAATGQIRWGTDGTSIVLATVDDKAREGFYRVDLRSGEVTLLHRFTGTTAGHFDLSPDGRTLFYGVPRPDRTSDTWLMLVARDLETGKERDVGEIGWPGRLEVSPDGSRVAAVVHDPSRRDYEGSMGTLPVDGGAPTPLHGHPAGSGPAALTWTPDGSSILYFTYRPIEDAANRDVTLWRAQANGEATVPVRLIDHVDPAKLALHPDGRNLAFMAGESRGEVWVMEGFEGASTNADDVGNRR
jgi:Tol biopolymer transport system component